MSGLTTADGADHMTGGQRSRPGQSLVEVAVAFPLLLLVAVVLAWIIHGWQHGSLLG